MQHNKTDKSAVILRQGRTERWLFLLLPVFVGTFSAVLFSSAQRDQVLFPVLFLFGFSALVVFPAVLYVWRWRMVLDRDGLRRRRLIRWKSHRWADLVKITKSRDGRGNEQLWVWFTDGTSWYFFSRYDGYLAAKNLLRKHKSIELRDKGTL